MFASDHAACLWVNLSRLPPHSVKDFLEWASVTWSLGLTLLWSRRLYRRCEIPYSSVRPNPWTLPLTVTISWWMLHRLEVIMIQSNAVKPWLEQFSGILDWLIISPGIHCIMSPIHLNQFLCIASHCCQDHDHPIGWVGFDFNSNTFFMFFVYYHLDFWYSALW